MKKLNRVTTDGVRLGSALTASKEREVKPLSRPQSELLADLRQRGPVQMFMGWPYRGSEMVLFRRSRVTASTFDALEKRGLIEWNVVQTSHGLARIYSARTEAGDALRKLNARMTALNVLMHAITSDEAEAAGRTEYERVTRNPKEGK